MASSPADEAKKKALKPEEKEFAIKLRFSPRRFLRKLAFLVVLLLVFFAGRWTAPDALGDGTDTETGSSWSITGFLSGLVARDEPATTTVEADAATAEDNATETTDTPAEEAADSGITTAAVTETEESAEVTEEEESTEPVITSYSKVAIALNRAIREWKETYGSIDKIEYTIRNNEAGIIKPAYFIMTVEGYTEEADKMKISLPLSAQEMPAGAVQTKVINLPKRFNYHPSTAGNIQNVRINLVLFDASNKPMASFSKEFDLTGSSP